VDEITVSSGAHADSGIKEIRECSEYLHSAAKGQRDAISVERRGCRRNSMWYVEAIIQKKFVWLVT
jgi:hypothetical protein